MHNFKISFLDPYLQESERLCISLGKRTGFDNRGTVRVRGESLGKGIPDTGTSRSGIVYRVQTALLEPLSHSGLRHHWKTKSVCVAFGVLRVWWWFVFLKHFIEDIVGILTARWLITVLSLKKKKPFVNRNIKMTSMSIAFNN